MRLYEWILGFFGISGWVFSLYLWRKYREISDQASKRSSQRSKLEPKHTKAIVSAHAGVLPPDQSTLSPANAERVIPNKAAASFPNIRKLIWVPISIVSLTLIFALIFALAKKRNQPFPEEEVHEAVDNIRSRVSSITLEESHLVFIDAPPPKFQYMLTINSENGGDKDTVYLFERYKYIVETGGDETKTPTAKLCDLVNAVYDRKDPILEALREVKASGKVSFPVWKVASGELEMGNVTPIMVEILYSIRKFVELKTTHPEIMIRGYADGQIADWSKELMGAPYNYSQIQAYPSAVDPTSKNPNSYSKSEITIDVPSQYKNEHLPDLRAFFVKKDLVDPYLELCKGENGTETHVIKGYEFKDKKNQPLERKVQVFILIYDN